MIDLLFPAAGQAVPIDHRYALYGALSRVVPEFHTDSGLRFSGLTGTPTDRGEMRLTDRSRVRVRAPNESVRIVLPLADRRLDVAGRTVQLGTPSVVPVGPSPVVWSPLVTFKNAVTPDHFLDAARTKLAELGVFGVPLIPLIETGARAGEPRRRIVRIRGRAVIGYALIVGELSDEDSVRLQEYGLGGRTRLGCGFFLPIQGGSGCGLLAWS